jgi:hypothetical protein
MSLLKIGGVLFVTVALSRFMKISDIKLIFVVFVIAIVARIIRVIHFKNHNYQPLIKTIAYFSSSLDQERYST